MTSVSSANPSRRKFLKYVGAGAVVAAVGAIAGSYYELAYLPSQESAGATTPFTASY